MRNALSIVISLLSLNSFAIVNGSVANWEKTPNILKLNITKVVPQTAYSKFEFKPPSGCTGFAINKDYAITAAHCLDYRNGETNMGNRVIYKYNDRARSESFGFVIHPSYKSKFDALEAKKNAFFRTFNDPNNPGNLRPDNDEALFEQMLNELVSLSKECVKYDIAIVKTNNHFANIIKDDHMSKISTNPDHGITYSTGTNVTLWGFGHTHIKISERNTSFESKLRYGYNAIKSVEDGVIITEGTLNQLRYVNWLFNEDSMVSWGDSGGPLTLKDSDGIKVIGINSMINPYYFIKQGFVDNNIDRGENYYTDLNSSIVKSFIESYTKNY